MLLHSLFNILMTRKCQFELPYLHASFSPPNNPLCQKEFVIHPAKLEENIKTNYLLKLKTKSVVLFILLCLTTPAAVAQTNQWELVEGFKLERVATGFNLAVNIAFVPNPKNESDSPLYYITELYGSVKVILQNGEARTYADGLLNFTPSGEFPGTGEIGLTGIVVDPESGDLFVTMAYEDEDYQEFGLRKNRVVRLHSDDGGLRAAEATIILDNIPGLVSGPYASHQIQAATIGPDAKLYVQIGDGFLAYTAQEDEDLRGKILRMNLDGSIPEDNPNPDSYVYEKGVRNPFGGAWRVRDQTLYISDNGPSENDRLAKVEAGANLGWPVSMLNGAIKLWNPTVAPTAIAFCYTRAFPDSLQGRLFVGLSGPTYWPGQTSRGKRIEMFSLADDGTVTGEDIFLRNVSDSSRSTIVGLTFGPDGLHFSDLYGERGFDEFGQTNANIYRISPTCNNSPFDGLSCKAIPFQLKQNYPNPFNAETIIQYDVFQKEKIRIDVFDVLGNRVRHIFDGVKSPGQYTNKWDGRDENDNIASSGVYVYRLQGESYSQSRKMLFIR